MLSVLFKKSCPIARPWQYSPIFPSKFALQILNYNPPGTDFCIWYEVGYSFISFLHGYPIFSEPFIEQIFLSP